MPIALKAKYLKSNQYDNLIFSSSKDIDQKSYQKLVKIAHKINEDFPNTYLPIYDNKKGFVSITTIRNDSEKLKQNGVYTLKIELLRRKKRKDGSDYVAVKLVKQPKVIKLIEIEEKTYDLDL